MKASPIDCFCNLFGKNFSNDHSQAFNGNGTGYSIAENDMEVRDSVFPTSDDDSPLPSSVNGSHRQSIVHLLHRFNWSLIRGEFSWGCRGMFPPTMLFQKNNKQRGPKIANLECLF